MSYFQVFYLCLLSSPLLICSVLGMPIPHVAVDEKVMSYSIKNQVASTLSCMAKADQIAPKYRMRHYSIPFNTTSVMVFWEGGEGTSRGNFFFVWILASWGGSISLLCDYRLTNKHLTKKNSGIMPTASSHVMHSIFCGQFSLNNCTETPASPLLPSRSTFSLL